MIQQVISGRDGVEHLPHGHRRACFVRRARGSGSRCGHLPFPSPMARIREPAARSLYHAIASFAPCAVAASAPRPFNRHRKGYRLEVADGCPFPSAFPAPAPHPPLTDSHGRVIHDLRVSITDRCNYKCVYCRTGEVGAQYPELGIDEYLRLIGLFVEPRHHQGAADGRRAAVAPRTGRTGSGTGAPAHARRRAAGPGADHQRPSAGVARRSAESCRAEPGDGQHGRRGRAGLRAHHAGPGQLCHGSRGHSRRPRRRA